jgi:hypothetical protein
LPDKEGKSSRLNSQEALTIMGMLVASDPPRYLVSASNAVRNHAVRLASIIDEPTIMHVSPELLAVMVTHLCASDVAVSSKADESLLACCRTLGVQRLGKAALQALVSAWTTARNGSGSAQESTVCVRCVSCIADIAAISDEFMSVAVSTGAMSLLLELLADDTDVLLQISSLDILEKLAMARPLHHERAQWLFSEAVLSTLLNMAGGMESTVPDAVLGGPALRVLAQLCKQGQQHPELVGRSGDLLLKGFHQALHNFDVNGELDRLAKLDAISSFASASADALTLVLDDPVIRKDWLNVSVAQPKLKAAILQSVAMVLDPAVELDVNGEAIVSPSSPDSSNSWRKLYVMLGQTNDEEPTKLVLTLARGPLPEIRLGCYAIFMAIAKLPTGGQMLFGDPQFLNFLLTRDGEYTKEGREAKYKLVQTIYDADVRGLLAEEIVKRIQIHLKQGAHFVETVTWEVATEEK